MFFLYILFICLPISCVSSYDNDNIHKLHYNKRYHYLDASRVGAMGASYGGYMINWINGHTNRFKCLVNHDGIFSLNNLYYTTEELWFPGDETYNILLLLL